jgi:SAM-dependent methyltransferase
VRLLTRLPEAAVVAIDADPVTLALGQAGYASVPGLRFADLDLRESGWVSRLGLEAGRPVDAVVSTTALHWLSAAEPHDLYVTLAGLLRSGGLFLDGDHLHEDETSSPVLARLDRALEEREDRRRHPDGPTGRAESWDEWWQAVAADPALAAVAAERSRGLVHHSNEGPPPAGLSGAGFADGGSRRCSRRGGWWFWGGVEDAGEPVSGGGVIVCRWGRRFPARGVSVCVWGSSATETAHGDLCTRPACWAW